MIYPVWFSVKSWRENIRQDYPTRPSSRSSFRCSKGQTKGWEMLEMWVAYQECGGPG